MTTVGWLVMTGVVVAACSGSVPVGTTSSPSPNARATEVRTATAALDPTGPAPRSAAPSVDATGEATPIPGCLPECVPGGLTRPGDLPPGDYTTRYFFGGQLTVTIPGDGWTSFEDSTGEFGLRSLEIEGSHLQFWLDVYPIVDPGTTPVAGVDRTAVGVLGWVETNPNIEVIGRRPARLGGLEAEALDVGRAANAENVDPECPEELRPCVGLFGFPQWDGFFSEGGPFRLRLIAADAMWGGRPHVIYAIVAGPDEDAFAEFVPASMTMIDGAELPIGVRQ
jgi:hypothetical protein